MFVIYKNTNHSIKLIIIYNKYFVIVCIFINNIHYLRSSLIIGKIIENDE